MTQPKKNLLHAMEYMEGACRERITQNNLYLMECFDMIEEELEDNMDAVDAMTNILKIQNYPTYLLEENLRIWLDKHKTEVLAIINERVR